MATKPFVTVSLLIHGGDTNIDIADYVDDNGVFVPLGTQVAAAVEAKRQIHFVDGDGNEVIIPFHSIEAANVTKEDGEYTPAEDEFCGAIEKSKVAVVDSAIVDVDQAG